MVEPISCDLCRRTIPAHGHFVVRIDVFEDPSTPPMTFDELTATGGKDAIAETLRTLGKLSVDELQDAVHRHFEYRLCGDCHRAYLANPLGQPRTLPMGEN